ncbi:MAG: hypothetical protein NTNFB02_29780 [Nitrospira sp.]
MKKESRALTAGIYQPVDAGPKECLLYQRLFQTEDQTEAILIAVNFSARVQTITLSTSLPIYGRNGTLILSTDPQRDMARWTADRFQLGADEGIVVRLE